MGGDGTVSENRVPCDVFFSTGWATAAECDPIFDHWGVWVDMPEALPIDGRFDPFKIDRIYFPFLDATWNVELDRDVPVSNRIRLRRVSDS